jgi:hypothetical protein
LRLLRCGGLEAPQRRGERVIGGNSLEQPCDAKRIVYAPGGTHEAQAAALAREPGALAHQRADAGAVNLDEAAQVHKHFLPALGGQPLQFVVEQFAVFAERGAAARLDHNDIAILARGDFEFLMVGVHNFICGAIQP